MIISTIKDYLNLAKICREKKEFERAIALCGKVISIDPQEFIAYRELGDIYTESEQLDKAIHYYQIANQLQPNSWLILQKIGNIFLKKADLINAAVYFQRSINLNPNFLWSHNNLGIVMEKLGVIDLALSCYEKVIELHPDFIGAYHNLVKIQEELGNNSQLIKNYQKIIELKPDAWWFYQKLGVLLEKQEELDRAIALYEKVITLNPQLPWAYQKLGKIYEKSGDANQLINLYQKVIKQNPESWITYEKLAKLCKEQGHLERAIALYEKVIKLNPKLAWSYEQLAEILASKNQWQKIINLCQVAYKIHPHNYLIPWYVGDAYKHQEKFDQAFHYLIKSLEIKNNHRPAYKSIADILQRQGNHQAALNCRKNCHLPKNLLIKYCDISDNMITQSRVDPHTNYHLIHSEAELSIPASKTINKKIHPSFNAKHFLLPPAYIAKVEQARIFWNVGITAIFNKENKLVTDLSKGRAELIVNSPTLPDIESKNETIAFLASGWSDNLYYHWMFDVVARIALIQDSSMKFEQIDKFVFKLDQKKFQEETLIALNIPQDKIINVNHVCHWQVKNLIIPFRSSLANIKTLPWACHFLKNLFLAESQGHNNSKYPDRIYISRSQAIWRKVLNEEDIQNFLEKKGFVSLTLENMTVKEQAIYLANAKVIVAPHGAGLVNLVFCQTGTKVIEIFAPTYVPNMYWQISNICNLKHFHLLGEVLPNLNKQESGWKPDIYVDLFKLGKILKLAGC